MALALLALLAQALLEAMPELVQIEPRDRRPRRVVEIGERSRIFQPFEQLLRNLPGLDSGAAKVSAEREIEIVEVAFGVDEQGASGEVEAVERALVQPLPERLGQRDRLVAADRYAEPSSMMQSL